MVELRALALKAREKQVVEEAEAEAQRIEEARERGVLALKRELRRLLGEEIASAIEVTDRRVTIDGLTLGVGDRDVYGSRERIVVFDTCPKCGAEVESEFVATLGHLGALVERFEPSHYHDYDCRERMAAAKAADAEAVTVAPEPSLEARLMACLREIARGEWAEDED